ncbi:hypothetical protein AV530_020016 [Patagioenas fasciata monilis]|uniref:Uncharacterized protein n=1 Tax=Patagioenas fasciata monilis TaxID=372326 RepID=A0A1V4JHQ1_PATFA|nr:hypothetical protein AV530_020016 [Patagioenas fasciata monilis]
MSKQLLLILVSPRIPVALPTPDKSHDVVAVNHSGEDEQGQHQVGTAFISSGKDLIEIIYYDAVFYQ